MKSVFYYYVCFMFGVRREGFILRYKINIVE